MKLWAAIPAAILFSIVAASAVVLVRGEPRQIVSEGRIGRPAPTFALSRLEGGGLVTSDQFAGRPHLINLFASWCVPCRAEHPQLMALKAQGVEILGVAYKDETAATQGFLSTLGDPFTAVGQDPDGRFALELGTAGVPETFVIGADGRILAVVRGPLTPEVIEQTVMPALRAP